MADASGAYGGSALFSMRYNLQFLMHSKQVNFHQGRMLTFIDLKGITYRSVNDDFDRRRKEILNRFITHFERDFTPDIVMGAVDQAEAHYLADRIQEIVNAKNGLLQGREVVSRRNLRKVMVLLQEPPPHRVENIIAQGIDPRGVFMFEIEGKYFLPKGDVGERLQAIYDSCTKGPKIGKYQRKLVLKSLEEAERTLNGMCGRPPQLTVSAYFLNSHICSSRCLPPKSLRNLWR